MQGAKSRKGAQMLGLQHGSDLVRQSPLWSGWSLSCSATCLSLSSHGHPLAPWPPVPYLGFPSPSSPAVRAGALTLGHTFSDVDANE